MSLQLHVDHPDGLLDLPRRITISGASPGRVVSVRATTERNGVRWSAQASWLASDTGEIDLGRDAPASGDIGRVDPMGLWWAQLPEQPGANPWPHEVTQPLRTQLTAWEETLRPDAPATAEVSQRFVAEGVQRTEIRHAGLVGTLFTPPGDGPFRTVVVLNGSGGGINEARASLYASRGLQAFALGYFRAPGLPDSITRTPLEYLQRGLQWAASELSPVGGRVAVSGQSRGGELSLLLGTRFPELVDAVAAIVPGAYVHGAQGASGGAGWDAPAWTWQGEPLLHLWQRNPGVSWQPWDGEPPPQRHRNVFIDGLRDAGFAEQVRIPVERIQGPVLCVSGMDDRAWPSSLYSRIVVDAVRRSGGEAHHCDYPDAGHAIGLPNLPSTQFATIHPVSGVPYSNGGTARGNAVAGAESFEAIVRFLSSTPAPRS